MTETVAIIQARMGSSRLPGKVMLPLDCRHALLHEIERVQLADEIHEAIVATSEKPHDDIISQMVRDSGAKVSRGSEEDVLRRMYEAARDHGADNVVRLTGDCPLIDPETIDCVVGTLKQTNADYVSNIGERSFPRGLDVEAFTMESFDTVEAESSSPSHREHVTPYYRENTQQFSISNVYSEDVFDKEYMMNRTDLRLTLDEAADYELLRTIFENVKYDFTPDIRDVVRYVDEHNLSEVNASVQQKSLHDGSGN